MVIRGRPGKGKLTVATSTTMTVYVRPVSALTQLLRLELEFRQRIIPEHKGPMRWTVGSVVDRPLFQSSFRPDACTTETEPTVGTLGAAGGRAQTHGARGVLLDSYGVFEDVDGDHGHEGGDVELVKATTAVADVHQAFGAEIPSDVELDTYVGE